MPINDTKTTDQNLDDVFNYVLGKLAGPAKEETDPVKEYQRLLKAAEAEPDEYRANRLISIADRHIKIVQAGLAYQK